MNTEEADLTVLLQAAWTRHMIDKYHVPLAKARLAAGHLTKGIVLRRGAKVVQVDFVFRRLDRAYTFQREVGGWIHDDVIVGLNAAVSSIADDILTGAILAVDQAPPPGEDEETHSVKWYLEQTEKLAAL